MLILNGKMNKEKILMEFKINTDLLYSEKTISLSRVITPLIVILLLG